MSYKPGPDTVTKDGRTSWFFVDVSITIGYEAVA